jgi:hypothetical protein
MKFYSHKINKAIERVSSEFSDTYNNIKRKKWYDKWYNKAYFKALKTYKAFLKDKAPDAYNKYLKKIRYDIPFLITYKKLGYRKARVIRALRAHSKRFSRVYRSRYRRRKRKRKRFVRAHSRSSKHKTRKKIFRLLPSFVSLLIRLFYVTKNKFASFFAESVHAKITDTTYFYSIYRRFLLYWRAIVFFKCFKKTVNAPDCLVLVNPEHSVGPVLDFAGLNIPVISVADSNTSLHKITYFVPSNDDSVMLLIFFYLLFLNACDSGMHIRYNANNLLV